MGLIAIDFDHTINNNSDKEEGARFSNPFPQAKEFITELKREGHYIMIFSCNRAAWIEEWMNHWEIPFDYIWAGTKPVADVYLDDRAVGFRGSWTQAYNDIKELLND